MKPCPFANGPIENHGVVNPAGNYNQALKHQLDLHNPEPPRKAHKSLEDNLLDEYEREQKNHEEKKKELVKRMKNALALKWAVEENNKKIKSLKAEVKKYHKARKVMTVEEELEAYLDEDSDLE